MLLVLLTRILLFASIGLLIWYVFTKVIAQKYLAWFGGVLLIALLIISFAIPDDGTIQSIWRLLSFPLTPLGASLIFIGVSLSEGGGKMKPRPAAIALFILLFSSTPLFSRLLVSQAEQSIREAYVRQAELCGEVCRIEDIPGTGNLAEAAAIVVLGDRNDINRAITISTDIATADAPTYTALAPRIDYAAELYAEARRLGGAPFVVVTAGSGNEDSTQRDIIRDIMARNGIASQDIQIENSGLDIKGAANDVADFLEDQQLIDDIDERLAPGANEDAPRVVLVAPAMMMSRAALTFERIGLQTIARPTSFSTLPLDADGLTDDLTDTLLGLIPSVDALRLTTEYWDELLTSLYYFLRGWLPDFNFGWDSSIEL
ncbi:YdcF family protein [cf. Phormidesmis sp. LEGE 11477]|uniref:YdcF family protein n=1 Tax=cf. Phormidesmis sp. LEGE 11477 TaxID=1828680 RepID=UPI001881E023|nr:YdcF family protein [cf. Phormidesmis sp. LEGE 11477]MBE9062671.1 YdcF family protein [cf. Phormidesmis sp. LEGE 11477]